MASARESSRATSSDSALVVFARFPVPGRVKTRLAQAIGDEPAASLYAAFVSDLARTFAGAPFVVRWAIAPPDLGFAARFGLEAKDVFPQEGADLGARMDHALRSVLDAGFAGGAIIGSDMPQLSRATVERAFAEMRRADLVLGPADDGGYYLIAARRPIDVFRDVRWGSDGVLAATRARAARLGIHTVLLESGFDIDVVEDLERLRAFLARNRAAREALPATGAALAALR